jgi:predicted transglutaminase-like cysteine proteinase
MMRFLLLLVILIGTASSSFAQQASFAFGGLEMKRIGYSMFPKWVAMQARAEAKPETTAAGAATLQLPGRSECVPNPRFPCAVSGDRYGAFLDTNRSLARDVQLKNVNRFLNASAYITDPVNWGVSDYWAALREFLKRDGDCEDYAIAKYMSLKALGWNPAEMRVVVVQDENLGVPHAILAVKLDGKTYILDNQNREMLPDSTIVHYRPFYSLNDTGFWIHAPKS